MATFEVMKFDGRTKNGAAWFAIKDKNAFAKWNKAGNPIRVVHPNGSWSVVKNRENCVGFDVKTGHRSK